MILTDKLIKDVCSKGDIKIVPFEDCQIEPASYDLRVGKHGATTSTKKIVDIEKQGYMLIEPGDFAIVGVLEEITLGSKYAGRIGLRSKFARKGLIATAGSQVDPGYHGRLKIGLTNLTPKAISLPFKDDFITLEIHELTEPALKPYDGPYQDQLDLSPADIEAVTEGSGMALSEMMVTLSSLSQNVGRLSTDFEVFQKTLKIVGGILSLLIAIATIIVALK
ncbi:MAG: dCTP deaminase [Dissulfurispiraceae bacterium]